MPPSVSGPTAAGNQYSYDVFQGKKSLKGAENGSKKASFLPQNGSFLPHFDPILSRVSAT